MIVKRKALPKKRSCPMDSNTTLWTGTAAGTFLSVLPNLHSEDIVKTIILATVGAIVSFVVSILIKLLKRTKKKVRF